MTDRRRSPRRLAVAIALAAGMAPATAARIAHREIHLPWLRSLHDPQAVHAETLEVEWRETI